MHPVRFRTHYTPTSVGALMDPGFLRHAVNDMVATTDAQDAPAARSRWRTWPEKLAARFSGLLARLSASVRS
jgi:hypothetical protein